MLILIMFPTFVYMYVKLIHSDEKEMLKYMVDLIPTRRITKFLDPIFKRNVKLMEV